MDPQEQTDFTEFLSVFLSLPPEDQRFLKRLIIEVSERNWTDDASPGREQILDVTKEIAPERLDWVTHCLARCREAIG